MKTIVTYALKGLKTRKVQTIALWIIFSLVSLGLFGSLGLMNSLQKPFETMFEEAKGGHYHLSYSEAAHPKALDFWQNNEAVEDIAVMPSATIYKNPTLNDKQLPYFLIVTENTPRNVEKIKLMEGPASEGPLKGEIWVTSAMAASQEIQLDDMLYIPGDNGMVGFKVTGIVLDPHFSTTNINPVRAWVSPGTVREVLDPNGDEQTLEVRLKSYDAKSSRKLWNDFTKDMGGTVYGFKMDYEITQRAFTFVIQINGTFMMVFAILILTVSLVILGLTMSGVILSEYRQIGILRAQGFSILHVRLIYGLQMIIMAASGILAGFPAGYMLMRALAQGFSKTSGLSLSRVDVVFITLVSLLILLGMTILAALASTRSIRSIRPYQAIQFGTAAKQHHIPVSKKMSALPLPVLTGMRELRHEPRHAWVIGLISGLMVFILLMAAACRETMVDMALKGSFSGQERTDLGITLVDPTRITDEELTALLDRNPDVEVHAGSAILWNNAIDVKDEDIKLSTTGYYYDEKISELEFFRLEGRVPSNGQEIAITKPMAELTGAQMGEYITIDLEKHPTRLLVVGMFETTNNGGVSFIVQESAVLEEARQTYLTHRVRLKDGVNSDEWLEKYFDKYGTAISIQNSQKHMREFSGFLSTVILASSIPMAIVLLAICMVTVVNLTIIHLLRVQQQHGIWLSLGRSSNSIRLSVLFKDLFPLLAGGMLGLILSLMVMPGLFLAIFGMLGFREINVIHSTAVLTGAIPITALPILLASWITSGRIKRISPRSLIVD